MPRRIGLLKMAGISHNNNRERESRIESWMRAIILHGGVDRYDDLHIDRIDARWKDQKVWISAGLQVYDLALNIRDREQLPFSVVLGFSLISGTQRKGVNFVAIADIERELGGTPPSLYLFRPGEEPWTEAGRIKTEARTEDVMIEKVDPAVFGGPLRASGCFYVEFKTDTESEYSRSILVAG